MFWAFKCVLGQCHTGIIMSYIARTRFRHYKTCTCPRTWSRTWGVDCANQQRSYNRGSTFEATDTLRRGYWLGLPLDVSNENLVLTNCFWHKVFDLDIRFTRGQDTHSGQTIGVCQDMFWAFKCVLRHNYNHVWTWYRSRTYPDTHIHLGQATGLVLASPLLRFKLQMLRFRI